METLVKNALIADGSGNPLFKGDILIEGDSISEISTRIKSRRPGKILDAAGLLLCPGFIDSHSHSDVSILAAPEALSRTGQGITTEITGNCGLSAFPVTDKNHSHLEELFSVYNQRISWGNFNEYRSIVQKAEPAVNILSLCGHNTLRAAVAGYEKKRLSHSKINAMNALLDGELVAGAAGLSTGLLYVPGIFAGDSELIEILSVAAGHNKPYATHLRSEGKKLIEAVKEALNLSAMAGISRLHLSHLKTAGMDNWKRITGLLELVDNPPRGVTVTADRYPYIESMTQLCVIAPPPWDVMDSVSIQKNLKEKGVVELFEERLRGLFPDSSEKWNEIILVSTSFTKYRDFRGATLAGIAMSTGKTPARVCSDIIKNDAVSAMAAFKGMSHKNMMEIIKKDYVCCGSDGNALPGDFSIGRGHPRSFGSFPRFFKYLKNEQGIPETVRRMTSLPATIFNIPSRGLLKKGFKADMVLLDPDKFDSDADFSTPHKISEGLELVMVNGRIAFESGCPGERAGCFIF